MKNQKKKQGLGLDRKFFFFRRTLLNLIHNRLRNFTPSSKEYHIALLSNINLKTRKLLLYTRL